MVVHPCIDFPGQPLDILVVGKHRNLHLAIVGVHPGKGFQKFVILKKQCFARHPGQECGVYRMGMEDTTDFRKPPVDLHMEQGFRRWLSRIETAAIRVCQEDVVPGQSPLVSTGNC